MGHAADVKLRSRIDLLTIAPALPNVNVATWVRWNFYLVFEGCLIDSSAPARDHGVNLTIAIEVMIMEEKECPVIHDGKQCGLPLTKIDAGDSKHNGLHECPRGHRSFILSQPDKS